ncbi:MAG: nicotinate-nucleotide--dimethylbenzimidazole phosphoribosyltransferase [Planctomycetota bacterium]|nr:nicotinate-nucleotide--dimethylbenzimidazole phosphoribosyltransferase [Planctomycetota bacterium]
MSALTPDLIQAHLDALTKPPRSLGRLETLAARLCGIQGTLAPRTRPRRLVVFAGDHGCVASGVSAWPQAVTRAVLDVAAQGRSACAVLARSVDCELELVDVGSCNPPASGGRVRVEHLAFGTRDLAFEPAMTAGEWRSAFEIGAARGRRAHSDGIQVAIAGEVGIGNTTSAAALAALVLEVDPDPLVGRGAGADDAQLERKRSVVRAGVARARGMRDPESAFGAVGGYEIAAMAGFQAECASRGMVVVLDGAIASAAALCAERLRPGTRDALIAAHRSVEPAHAAMLAHLALEPHLEWDLRLGEGTGALLLVPLLDAAAALVSQMATFDDLELGGAAG